MPGNAIVAATDGWTTWVAQAPPYGRASFRAVRDLLAPFLGITAGDDAETVVRRITDAVAAVEAAELAPPLAALHGLPSDDATWRGSDDQERLRRIQEDTGGFTAFIPWMFAAENTALGKKVQETTAVDYLKTLAVSRLYLDNIDHIQSSWLTPGTKMLFVAVGFSQLRVSVDSTIGL